MRGTRTRIGCKAARPRFIPACAGNTFPWPSASDPIAVHPRLCGEHSRACFRNRSSAGSSPPVRGTRQCVIGELTPHRFIPACAGNTSILWRRLNRLPVHPRLCGEHALPFRFGRASSGSSPPVRGTRQTLPYEQADLRFIPACAGNTAKKRPGGSRTTVHPRLCGEHPKTVRCPRVSLGSSPPVRGTL